MDQSKIGKFITECRKKKGLTQMQLAEKLNITDRAISKWERGLAMPDSSIMLELCSILGISVNELLSGEVLGMENYNNEAESKLVEMIKQKEESDKHLLRMEIVIGVLSTLILLAPVIIAALLPMQDWQRIVIAFSGFIPAFLGFFYAVKIEQIAGFYECRECKHRYVPSYKAVSMAMHMGRKRYMSCPNCNKKSWQRKVISKD